MRKKIFEYLESVVKNKFYKTYNIVISENNDYEIQGGIVSSKREKSKKPNRKKEKKYCATNYMKIE